MFAPGENMRIAFIGQANSIHFYRRVDWFARQGHDVLVLGHEWPELPEYSPRVRLRLCGFRAGRSDPLNTLAWMRKELEAFGPDVLHVHKLDYPGVFGLFLGFHPLVVTLWDGIVVRDPRIAPAARQLTALAGARAELFTTNSPELLRECVQAGVPESKALLTSWGVDSTLFRADSRAAAQVRAGYGLDSDAVVVFSPRVLTGFSNLDIVVQAMEQVAAKEPRLRLLMAAYASTDDGVAGFNGLLARSSLRERLVYCGKIQDQEELAAHYAASDILLSLYSGYLESSPASVIEAMLCGAVPVVADHPVIPFWVRDGVEGSVVRHRDPGSVASGIRRALDMRRADPDLMRRNRKKVLRQADYHRTMPMVQARYEELRAQCPAGFVRPGPEPVEEGMLLEVLGHEQAALERYERAGDLESSARLQRWLAGRGRYVDPQAAACFGRGGPEELAPPPSGDLREYVWAAPLRSLGDVAACRQWCAGLAQRFHYDPDYVAALAALAPEADAAAVQDLLRAVRPCNLLLVPLYRELASRTPDGARQQLWTRLAEASWQARDPRFTRELKTIGA